MSALNSAEAVPVGVYGSHARFSRFLSCALACERRRLLSNQHVTTLPCHQVVFVRARWELTRANLEPSKCGRAGCLRTQVDRTPTQVGHQPQHLICGISSAFSRRDARLSIGAEGRLAAAAPCAVQTDTATLSRSLSRHVEPLKTTACRRRRMRLPRRRRRASALSQVLTHSPPLKGLSQSQSQR